ncbi:MAG: gliding motility protein GldM [Paludibacter sp.]|nr:gliding motility protein GldM [Paludibacter sp.]
MSGAKNCPETPRQKMIGMMYLVLTAMLALNVSSDILNGFTMVDNSLHTTIESSELRNKNLYDEFSDLNRLNPGKVKEWLEQANLVRTKSDELYNYLQDFKVKIVKMTDKDEANDSAYVYQIIGKDNLDKGYDYAVNMGNGKILKSKIDEYKNFLVGFFQNNPTKQKMYQTIFSTDNKNGVPWIDATFEMMPLSAVVTILTKYQSDVRSSEAEVVQYLKGQTDVKDFRVNKITALVVPNTPYVLKGGKYSAQIVLSAVDSTKKPEYFVGGSKINEKGLYEIMCNKAGIFPYSGQIKIQGNDGEINSYPFKSEYVVGEPSATISNEDLNVVYRGIDNKFNISVPGIASENVNVRVNGGTIRKVGDRYIIRPTQDGEININVYATIEGKDQRMGGGAYRVKYIPDPKSFLQYTDAGGVIRQTQDETLTKRTLLSDNISIVASYGEDELIKANFNVTSFTMVSPNGMDDVRSSKFSSRMKSYINNLEGGDYLIIKNIKAVGPDGKTRTLSPIQIQI